MKKTITILLVVFFTGLLSAQTVNIQGNPYGGNPYANLTAAITAANNGDIILITGVHTGTFTISKSITLRGTNPLTDIIQANALPNTATTRVITVGPAAPATFAALNVSIENLGIRHGNITGAGGGVFTDKITGLVTLKNLIIESNRATTNGAGLNTGGSNVDIIECTIKNNTATQDGGAIIAAPNNGSGIDNVVNIKQSIINANTARNGGGIYINGNLSFGNGYKIAVNIENSTVSNNTTTSAAGGNGGGAILSLSQPWTPTPAIGNVTLRLVHTTTYNNSHASAAKAGIQFLAPTVTAPTNFSAYNSIIANTDVIATKSLNCNLVNITNAINTIFGGLEGSVPAVISDVANNNLTGRTATQAGLTGTLSNEGGQTQVIAINGASTAQNYCTATTGISLPTIDQIGTTRTGTADAGAYEFAVHTTWTGGTNTAWTDASNWSNGVPTTTSNVGIGTGTNNPNIASDVAIKYLEIASGASIGVASGNLTVSGALINNGGTLTLENNANLIQGGTTNINKGNINVKRNSSPLMRLDYTLWSSPVAGQKLLTFSPKTLLNRFYNFNTIFNIGGVNGAYSGVVDPAGTNFAVGSGYLIRMPDDATTTPTAFPGVFTGRPNNGTISVTLVDGAAAGLRYNAVGNPYPSPIKMQNFVFDNTANIEPTLYFWRKTNGLGSAYCTWTAGALVTDPGTFVTNGNAQTVNPATIIQTGQGFFVEAKSGATSLNFNNSQRIANTTGQFFRTKQVTESSKIWLNATNTIGDFSQMAITYFEGATTGVDAFDAKYFNDSPIALTSNINDAEYTIQGRPAFDPTDVVALNFKTNTDGDYTIALDHFEGVFTAGQDVYLVDSKTGTETNLKAGAYTFNATSGIDNARFSLKFQKTLKVGEPDFNENSVSVYKNNGALYVNSGFVAMSNIKVFDIQGRLVAEQKNLKSTTAVFNNLKAKNQVLIIKIAGDNNNVVIKKILN